MGDGAHLTPAARAALDLPPTARIAHMRRPRWIGYPRAQQLLAKLDALFTHPKTHRMPNLLIVGDTNAGETMLANRCVQGHPAHDNPEGEAVIVPLLAVQAPLAPTRTASITRVSRRWARRTPRARVEPRSRSRSCASSSRSASAC